MESKAEMRTSAGTAYTLTEPERPLTCSRKPDITNCMNEFIIYYHWGKGNNIHDTGTLKTLGPWSQTVHAILKITTGTHHPWDANGKSVSQFLVSLTSNCFAVY
jgi:hypothetical protein